MITQTIYLDEYDWLLKVFYCEDGYGFEEINNSLVDIECDYNTLFSIRDLMTKSNKNEGFTYSDSKYRTTLMIIGPTTSASEFFNTYNHEKGHAVTHIAKANNIDLSSEEYQYLNGKISEITFSKAQLFLCDHCRSKLSRK